MKAEKDVALIMIDIDYFKKYNYYYRHSAGDIALCNVTRAISKSLPRDTDFVARFGDEEFVIVLSNTDTNGNLIVTKRIHEYIKELNIPHNDSSVSNKLTINVGISMLCEKMDTEFDFFNCTDEVLYIAKKNGRNKTEFKSKNHRCLPTKNPPAMPSGTTVE